ncbi:MAG: hypothetical protein ACYCV7_17640 [Acidimicrobiales bacterium]
MAGSVRIRPDKGSDAFELRVFVGRDASGRARHKSQLFHGTQRAAECTGTVTMATLRGRFPHV